MTELRTVYGGIALAIGGQVQKMRSLASWPMYASSHNPLTLQDSVLLRSLLVSAHVLYDTAPLASHTLPGPFLFAHCLRQGSHGVAPLSMLCFPDAPRSRYQAFLSARLAASLRLAHRPEARTHRTIHCDDIHFLLT